jgi:hypothetical protein
VSGAVFGQSLALTANVAAVLPGAGFPTGTITFTDENSNVLGSGTPDDSGNVTIHVSTLAVGSHTIHLSFAGDTAFTATTGSYSQVVSKAASGIAFSATSGSVFGQTVTFTANVTVVTPGAGTPSGSVSFFADENLIGSGTVTSGHATATISSLSVGTHAITAHYSGDGNFNSADATAANQGVGQDAVNLTGAGVVGAVFGQSLALTANVTAASPGAGLPSGTISFTDENSNALGSGTPDDTGSVTINVSSLSVGSHTIHLSYSGDGNFTSAGTSYSQAVAKAASGVTISTTAASVFGQSVTFTANVAASGPGAGTPTGSVSFFADGTLISSGTIASGQATATISSLTVGTHAITAQYGGDGNFTASSIASASQVVGKATAGVTLGSTSASVFGQGVTFTATLAAVAPGVGAPGGSVSFFSDLTPIGSGTISGGNASITLSSLAVGSHSITATYGGDTSFLTAQATTVTQVVGRAASSVSVTPTAASVFGQSVTFTATIAASAPGAGTPTGSVTFSTGSTNLGTQALDGSGIASISVSSLAVGSDSITASYGGDVNFTGQTGGLTQTVAKANSTTAIAGSASTATFGQQLTFTATLAPVSPGAGVPTGTVSFFDGSSSIGSGSLSAGTATFSTTSLALGSHSITAHYGGDAGFNVSISTGKSVTVQASGTFAFAAGSYTVNKDAGTEVVTVNRTAGTAGAATVGYAVTGGTAVNGTNFNLSSGTLSFTNGQSSNTITIPLIDDGIYGPNFTTVLTLSNPSAGTVIGATSSTTITLMETHAAPVVSVAGPTVTINATPTTATFNVNLSAASLLPVTVAWATVDGTAVAGTDYTAATGTLTFAPHQTTNTVTVAVAGKTTWAPTKTFSLSLSSPTNASLATGGAAVATLHNPNSAPITASDVSALYVVGQNVVVRPLSNASDPAGDTLTLSLLTQAASGTVTLGSDAGGQMFLYTPGAGDIAPDSFTYQISNGTGNVVTHTATVTPLGTGFVTNPFNAAQQDLVIITDDNNDTVKIVGKPGGRVTVSMNGVIQGTFKPTGRVVVMAGAGNDTVTATATTISCWFYGGSGRDTFSGSAGNDVLIGGSGGSVLNGFAGHNLLIGGTGVATLKGSGGVNVLIGGSTSYDDPSAASQAALQQILGNWKANLTQTVKAHSVSATPGAQLNSSTVFYNDQPDVLLGNARSWFFGRSSKSGGSDVFYNGKKVIGNGSAAPSPSLLITEV